ncbi:MAG: response regulator transcription factor [Puniceicoccaceae bacterium]
MTSNVLEIAIIEDQKLFQELLTHVVTSVFGYKVVGVAGDGIHALRLCRESNPGLVLLDICIPQTSGLVVAEILKAENPEVKILAVSSESDPVTIHRAFKIGFQGFLDKSTQTLETLTEAIHKVSTGGTYFSSSILKIRDRLLEEPMSFQKILSPREQEVLALIGGCYSDQEIGNLVGLSPSTVQTHRKNIMGKIGVHSTPELIRYALDNGFWKPHEERLNH